MSSWVKNLKLSTVQPVSGRQSFYYKAMCIQKGKYDFYLYSYLFPCVHINTDKKTIEFNRQLDENLLSRTTMTHIIAFLKHHKINFKLKGSLKNTILKYKGCELLYSSDGTSFSIPLADWIEINKLGE